MIIYVVEWWSWCYETGVSAVFSTREKANQWINGKLEKRREELAAADGYNIIEMELDSENANSN